MVSSIWTTLFDFIITMSGVAEVTRTSGGIVVGGLSEALRLGRSAYRFSSESKWVFMWLSIFCGYTKFSHSIAMDQSLMPLRWKAILTSCFMVK